TWTERVSFADDAAGTNRQLLGTFSFTESLAPSDPPLNRQESITVPTTGLSGPVYIVVEVDLFDSVPEIDEQNLFASSATSTIPATLTLTTDASSITEGSASLEATVTRNGDVSSDLTVTITPSDPAQVTLPLQVVIPAGQYSKRFDVAAAVDGIVDGDVQVTVTATAVGYTDGSVDVDVIDADQHTLTLGLGATQLAEGQTTTGTVTRSGVATSDILVDLSVSNAGQLDVPLAVVIPTGQSSVVFNITATDDTLVETAATYSIAVSAPDHGGDSATVDVPQNDVPALTLALPAAALAEGAAGPTVFATVTRDVVTDRDLLVEVTASDVNELVAPATVTIPANAAAADFTFQVLDDALVNGTRTVGMTVRVLPAGGGASLDQGAHTQNFDILDNDGPTLTVTIDRDLLAEGGSATATVSRNTDTTDLLTVTLASSDTTELAVPSPVEIPAGTAQVQVPVQGLDDAEIDGDQPVTVTATATGFNTGTATLIVSDTDLPDLIIPSLSGPLTGLTGETVDVDWTVFNDGFAPAEGTWV
ncbi:MAG: hypothetical protein ACC645_27830, partial [Pirellulales bacterium]